MYTKSSHRALALAQRSGLNFLKTKCSCIDLGQSCNQARGLRPPPAVSVTVAIGPDTSAKPHTTKTLNLSLKLTQNLSCLCIMPVCAWAVKVVNTISRLCNLKQHQLISSLCQQPFVLSVSKTTHDGHTHMVLPNRPSNA